MTWDEAKALIEQMAKQAETDAVVAGRRWGKTWAQEEASAALQEADALRLLLSHAIPREDRERALLEYGKAIHLLSIGVADADQYRLKARRLLKLDEEGRDA